MADPCSTYGGLRLPDTTQNTSPYANESNNSNMSDDFAGFNTSIFENPCSAPRPGLSLSDLDDPTPLTRYPTVAPMATHIEETNHQSPAYYGAPLTPQLEASTTTTPVHPTYTPRDSAAEATERQNQLTLVLDYMQNLSRSRRRAHLQDLAHSNPHLYLTYAYDHPVDVPTHRSMASLDQPDRGRMPKQANRETVLFFDRGVHDAHGERPRVVDEQERLFPGCEGLFAKKKWTRRTRRENFLTEMGPKGEVVTVPVPLPSGCGSWAEAQGEMVDRSRKARTLKKLSLTQSSRVTRSMAREEREKQRAMGLCAICKCRTEGVCSVGSRGGELACQRCVLKAIVALGE